MVTTLFIKPAEGCVVRDPRPPFAPLAADGEEKPQTGYWLRRVADGSVIYAERPKVKTKKTTPAVTEEAAANEPV
ncbi:DUF2635 domain-containing protein [Salmonella enterica]|nr:DUF2635 domain-containing protein [Salmonella enterica]EBR0085635.1 hypothetical protein [Salmonella enterica subsp. enterica serovar Wangata]EDT2941835.1 DUF2635 domain-containing protein [Salmonella enterica subsp. enterica]EDA8652382.1 DUF2635 domain-containing protein [Salmonella enterica subsp. enterica serovar Wangata]EGA9536931.1 DUF2635 domain-containing protein [Salmonella enterica]